MYSPSNSSPPNRIQVYRSPNQLKLVLPWKDHLHLPPITQDRLWSKWFSARQLSLRYNHLTISVDAQRLSLRHAPFPNVFAYGKKQYAIHDILQLYIRKTKTKRSTLLPYHQRPYALCAVLKNRKNVVLVDYLRSPVEALFLEQEVTHFFKPTFPL